MAHGYPDYGLAAALSDLYRVVDFAELSARLGGAGNFDRAGQVIYCDDFSEGLAWRIAAPAAGPETVVLHVDTGRKRGYMVRAKSNSSGGAICGMSQGVSLPVASRVGAEVGFWLDATWQDMELRVLYSVGGVTYGGVFRYLLSGHKLQVAPSGTSWYDVATGVDLVTSDYGFRRAKLVIDPATGKYVRLIVEGVRYDVSAHALEVTSGWPNGEIIMSLYYDGPAAVTDATGYWDEAVVTVNEP